MKEIIEEVFKAENKVTEILRQAREKASEIRQSADKESSEKINEAKQQARQIIQIAVENAKKEAENIRLEKLRQADLEKDAILSQKQTIDSLIDKICNIIIATEY